MTFLDKKYWQTRYLKNQTGWDLGYVSNPLKKYFDQLTNKNLKILIPGCGNGYEAEYLFHMGFENVFVLDITHEPIFNLLNRCPNFSKNNCFIEDFFEWQSNEKFDLIIEQTMFCAIDPVKRKDYLIKIHNLLENNGKYVGVLFNRTFDSGPPFGGNIHEYEQLFNPIFNDSTIEHCNDSIQERSGSEVFISCVK